MAEEMRILYVATTRARDRLILSACEKQKHCRDLVCNGFLSGAEPIADWQLRTCRSPLDWVLYGLSDMKDLHEAFETGLAREVADNDLLRLKLYPAEELDKLAGYILKLKNSKSARPGPTVSKSQPKRQEGKLLSEVKKCLTWRYGFGDAPMQPAKQSVTELTHYSDEYVKIDYSAALERQPKAVMVDETDSAEEVDGRLIGTATHLVISRLDLAKPVTAEAVDQIKEKLLADSAISKVVAEHIDNQSILNFFQSELGKTAIEAENTLWREWPFTYAMPASDLPDSSHELRAKSGGSLKAEGFGDGRSSSGGSLKAEGFGDGRSRYATYAIQDTIIVQGIIDMLAKTPRGLLVVDFKTDRINLGEVSERAEFYRQQLDLYGRAASAILEEKLIAKWLYFLTPGCATEI